MTEFVSAVEAPKSEEDKKHIARRIGSFAMETFINDTKTRNITGSLALLGAASTAAEFGHWFDHSGAALEFMQGSGRHFLVGYIGAMAAIAKSKSETLRGKLAAGLLGGMAGDVVTEALQAGIVTGALHHGSLKDIVSFVTPKEVIWGNAKDAGAAELAALGAVVQQSIVRN